MSRALAASLSAALLAASGSARADPPPAAPASKWSPSFSLSGYVEAAYTYAFNQPDNGIINYRGFDNRHNTFTISNAVVDASAKIGDLSARVAIQVGNTPNSYYASEPSLPGAAGAGASNAELWRFVQQAYAGWRIPKVAEGLTLEVGIFPSPIGLEVFAVKDNWNYSRSNLFVGLPFYHTGARVTLQATERLALLLMVVNGWNSVVDGNAEKSVISQATYAIPDRLTAALLYMVGVERPKDAPEGRAVRHLADAYAQVQIVEALAVAAEGSAGFERNRFGVSYWGAAAIYARVQPLRWLYLAARGDRFWEHRAANDAGTASAIFWPAAWVSSFTGTADVRPHSNVSLRLEYRHDQAASNMFFAGKVKGDGSDARPYQPDARAQDTITAGAIAWF